jgi:hypothetical protein
LVRAPPCPAGYHIIPFSYLVLHRYVGVGEGASVHLDELFYALGAAYLFGDGRVVQDVAGSALYDGDAQRRRIRGDFEWTQPGLLLGEPDDDDIARLSKLGSAGRRTRW